MIGRVLFQAANEEARCLSAFIRLESMAEFRKIGIVIAKFTLSRRALRSLAGL